jgi:hypothetical protein
MATTSLPAPEAQATISPFGRIIGVFFSPKATFEDIARRPSWIAPLALITVLSVIVCFSINQRMNWRDYISQQIEKSPQSAQMSAEQKAQRIEAGAKFAPIFTYVFGVPITVLLVLLTALLMWGAYNLLAGANASFGVSFAIVSHAFLVSVVSSVLFIAILFLKPFGTVDLDNPVAANVAAFLPDDSAKWLVTLCKQVDIFTFWILVLIAIGFAAANPKKLQGGKSFSIAFSVWLAWVVLRTGIAFAFS